MEGTLRRKFDKGGAQNHRAFLLAFSIIFLSLPHSQASPWLWLKSAISGGQSHGSEKSSKQTFSSQPSPKVGMNSRTSFDADSHAVATTSGRIKQRRLANQVSTADPEQSCWQAAYRQLVASCRQILGNETMKVQLSVQFANCFLRSSGRPGVACTQHMRGEACTGAMSDHEHAVYLAFFLDVDAECHHLQSEAFKQEVEHAVNALTVSAHWLEGELASMADQSEAILDSAAQSLAVQRQLASQQEAMSADLGEGFDRLGITTREIQSGLADLDKAQRQLAKLQESLGDHLKQAMGLLDDRTRQLSASMDRQVAGQEELLIGQAKATDQIGQIHALQSAALRSQRAAMASLAELAKEHHSQAARWHEEVGALQASLLSQHGEVAAELAGLANAAEEHHVATRDWHAEMETAQQRLAEGSASILQAQEAFMVKQAMVFSSLDRLFSLYGALLSETRTLKSVFFYGAVLAVAYALTSVPRTQNARLILFTATCAAFATEAFLPGPLSLLDPPTQTRVTWQLRGVLLLVGILTLVIFAATYRDLGALTLSLLHEQSKCLLRMQQALEGQEGGHSPQHLPLGGSTSRTAQLWAVPRNVGIGAGDRALGTEWETGVATSIVSNARRKHKMHGAKMYIRRASMHCRGGSKTAHLLAMACEWEEDEESDPDYQPPEHAWGALNDVVDGRGNKGRYSLRSRA